MRRELACLALLGVVAACGGDDTAAPPDSATAAQSAIAQANAARRAAIASGDTGQQTLVDTLMAAGERPLLRETFDYTGSSRDPFRSLITATASGPALTDLVLMAVLYDERNAANSVAVFRENGSNRRYTVHPGDRIGRLYVAGVTRSSATLRFDDYGTTRQQTYSLRPMEDEG